MKKILLLIPLFSFSVVLLGQTKKVLLEEFTGAHCGQCLLGTHYTDSMLGLYPNLVAVALHAYTIPDAMFFAQIDTLSDTYAQGAPLGAIDRICTGVSANFTAVFVNTWNTKIQQRLSAPAVLTLNMVPSWNSVTREITAQVSVNIVSNMSSGDYRLSLYVVEDSVSGIGTGYDQDNFYNTDASSPFFGMGNPIVGFVHRHVARALLPSSWGLTGLIPSAPVTGQNFNHTFNYILPPSYNENRVHLVALVNKFTSSHTGDEVLNVTEEKLLQAPTAVFENGFRGNEITVYLDPSSGELKIKNAELRMGRIEIFDILGEKILSQQLTTSSQEQISVNVSHLKSGIYFYKITSEEKRMYCGKMMIKLI